MKLKEMFIFLLLFGVTITATSTFFLDVSDRYNQTSTSIEALDQSGNLTDELRGINQKLSPEEETSEPSVFEIPGISAALNAVKVVISIPNTVDTMINIVVTELGLPLWIVGLVEGVMFSLIAFAVIAHFTKVDA